MCDVQADASREPDAKSFNHEIRGPKTPAVDRWPAKFALVKLGSSASCHAIFGLGAIYPDPERNRNPR